VPVLESWIDAGGEACLAMPYLDGPTLRQELRRGPLAPARAAGMIRMLGAALAEIHRHGIVHRDLKPENIILTRTASGAEVPVVIDFGNAGLRWAYAELSLTQTLAGSLQYMAPEGLTGHYSPATDVYSFGVVILEMLSGKTLSDLAAAFSDAGFAVELAAALRPAAGEERAAALAELLAASYGPVPARRPGAEQLSEPIAAALSTARG